MYPLRAPVAIALPACATLVFAALLATAPAFATLDPNAVACVALPTI